MFGFIKNFFGGIFSFFAGLLGLKKSEYFLDLGESSAKEPAKVAPAKAEPVAAAPAKAEPVKSEKSEPAKKAKEPVASVAAKTSEPAKVPAATNGKVSSQAQPVLTFAPNNLMPTPTGNRRSPGPSMNNFREMARQVKTK
ncbi:MULTISPECIES: hypothetical protein [unclassified Microcoleus]|uniref:hypothetical protein n=1 Tax=unclassified Microcoleus TaxID=2642155 RepID=UPI002FD12A78